MKKSLHFGLNQVSPAAYNGWPGWLRNPVNDARDTAAFYARAGFDARAYFDLECTNELLRFELGKSASEMVSGDTFLFLYSGHGGQSQAWSWNGYKETLCLADGELADTALREMFAAFKTGVRIVFLSDSCHSGGLARAVPPMRGKPAYVRSVVNTPMVREIPVTASVMLVAACQADELASDGAGSNGAFTSALLEVGESFEDKVEPLTWDRHVDEVQKFMSREVPTQHPVAERYGAAADWNVEVAS